METSQFPECSTSGSIIQRNTTLIVLLTVLVGRNVSGRFVLVLYVVRVVLFDQNLRILFVMVFKGPFILGAANMLDISCISDIENGALEFFYK